MPESLEEKLQALFSRTKICNINKGQNDTVTLACIDGNNDSHTFSGTLEGVIGSGFTALFKKQEQEL